MKIKLIKDLTTYNDELVARKGAIINVEYAVSNPYNILYQTVDGKHPITCNYEYIKKGDTK